MKFIELNHYIEHGTISYPGMPPVEISSFMERKKKSNDSGFLDYISMVNISGTYIDSPFHAFEDGEKIGEISLEKLVDLPTFVVKLADGKNFFDVTDFRILEKENLKQSAILLYSGFDKFYNSLSYGINPPYLTQEGAKWLVNKGVFFIGIDSPLIDNYDKAKELGNPVHRIILGAGSIICEDLTNLSSIPEKGALISAVPPRIAMSSFPARVYAKIFDL